MKEPLSLTVRNTTIIVVTLSGVEEDKQESEPSFRQDDTQ